MAEGEGANHEQHNIVDDFDLDSLLQGFDGDPIFDLDLSLLSDIWIPESDLPTDAFQSSDPSPLLPSAVLEAPAEESSSPESVSFVKYIENILMVDDCTGDGGTEVKEDGVAHFFSSVLAEGTDSGKSEACTPGTTDVSAGKEKDSPVAEEDDSISKKRRRQISNRESAMMSRERKKMYLKDLEMKNKYLELECRRLDYALRCCMAENIVLRQSLQLQMERPCGASVPKQESAVLFVESLPLGSLFWLVSIVFLFLASFLRSPNQKLSKTGRDPVMVANARVERGRIEETGRALNQLFVGFRRRCRSNRKRMKFLLFPFHAFLV
ncbi:hypothetical protein HPP92_003836 [Vanilla planifolia]|uniref:BZIP domain-containing protein n=1 Tax=Vanilla planifolia TaxID=51239 RepID=A0A835RV74_VANPL|nr:hypothetical protein HPP92_003836 [Vanilla planifolia]